MNKKLISLNDSILFSWYGRLIEQSISILDEKKLQNGRVEYYKQELLKQFFTHFLSIKDLSNGIKLILNGREKEISALPSIAVLVRACLENYSMFYYIYRESNSSDEEKEFRFWSWYREGLISRQRLNVSHLKESEEKQKDEKKRLDKLTAQMKDNSFFKKLTTKQQKTYLKDGKWYFKAKSELLSIAGFSESLASNCYNYFSSYTHPSSGSHLQTSQATYEDSVKIQKSMLKLLFISAGLYVYNYSKEFSDVSEQMNKEDKEFIESWRILGHELMK
jgi:hypothetical protein